MKKSCTNKICSIFDVVKTKNRMNTAFHAAMYLDSTFFVARTRFELVSPP